MVKKPAELRYGQRTVNQIEELSKTIKVLLKSLDGSVDAAKKMGLTGLHLDGVTKGERAVKLLKGFSANVEHALRREQLGL